MRAAAKSIQPPKLASENLYWTILSSGQFSGVTLDEMKNRWTISDLLDAHDVLMYNRAVDAAVAAAQDRASKRK